MRHRKNRFDVQVVFPDIAFGIKSRTDVEQTPETVATALEEFCARIRNGGNMPRLDHENFTAAQLAQMRADVVAGAGHDCEEWWTFSGVCALCDRPRTS